MAQGERNVEVETLAELMRKARHKEEARSFRTCRRALNAAEDFVDSIGGFENKKNWSDEDKGILQGLVKNVQRACDL